MNKQFITLSYEILKLNNINPTEKILLARIAGFDEYFESSAKCAELMCLKEDTISKAKRHLVELGYITETANTGRGKKYVVNDLLKTDVDNNEVIPDKATKNSTKTMPTPEELGLRASVGEKQVKRMKFEKRYAPYMQAYDRGLKYLRDHHIGVANKKGLQADFASLVDTFSEYPAEDVNNMLLVYFDYLESGQYAYQLEKTNSAHKSKHSMICTENSQQFATLKILPIDSMTPEKF